jgi:hypothetical protein
VRNPHLALRVLLSLAETIEVRGFANAPWGFAGMNEIAFNDRERDERVTERDQADRVVTAIQDSITHCTS